MREESAAVVTEEVLWPVGTANALVVLLVSPALLGDTICVVPVLSVESFTVVVGTRFGIVVTLFSSCASPSYGTFRGERWFERLEI